MEATKTTLVNYAVKNGVAYLELADPPANTYTHEMMRDLDDAILKARFDVAVHVIVIKGAGKLGLPEVTLGVLPGTGGTQRFARLVNKSTAIELMVTGETFDFEKGLQLGVINQIWETTTNAEFIEKIEKYAEQFCPPNKAAKAVGRIKRSVQSGVEIPFESALAVERELQQQLFQSEDAKEGLAAYVEKRKPNFSAK